ncbi:Fpg/Nei family DNA glycosylase [Agrococcus jejuensis]|uniref:DNA-(apurinic or apyrimidinic site) lyase n=1 Tax=Agrococcus jejuensis TaxID=399736 RepID=A0A1G8GQL5_9MICO|nr:DNA-formamidopyrimidine glycosylase family protein [Agrococcus jejuensis]SDH96672.1 endonuclease-8 [Agrococcus jejuensis]
MPEGHSVHRIARQFDANFVGDACALSSPQGRFADGAASLDGRTMTASRAIGKHLLLDFDGRWLHVHLGIYGAWDFAGRIAEDATLRSAGGRAGQTGMRGTVADGGFEHSLSSIGAPRLARLRMGESESTLEVDEFPPPPVGAVRVRILTATAVADLRGPTVCEVLDPDEVEAVAQRLGPDPEALFETKAAAERRFVERAGRSRQPIGQLLMDQAVVAGIGNVYRAELLFRARISPHRTGQSLDGDELRGLWKDWVRLLRIGVETGQMLTIDGLRGKRLELAMASRADRHWVYKREGLPCLRCGTTVALEVMQQRKLYWCPGCQS